MPIRQFSASWLVLLVMVTVNFPPLVHAARLPLTTTRIDPVTPGVVGDGGAGRQLERGERVIGEGAVGLGDLPGFDRRQGSIPAADPTQAAGIRSIGAIREPQRVPRHDNRSGLRIIHELRRDTGGVLARHQSRTNAEAPHYGVAARLETKAAATCRHVFLP